MSKEIASKGVVPRNRAVCEACYTAYRFDRFVEAGAIREVDPADWKP